MTHGAASLACEVTAFGARYRVDLAAALDASAPVRFGGDEVRAFSLPSPRRAPVTLGSFVGSVAAGGSVNCDELSLFPHGNGTHTECVGHLLAQGPTVLEVLPAGLVPAVVVSAAPTTLATSGERYGGRSRDDDRVVTRSALAAAITAALGDAPVAGGAVVVKTGLARGDLSGQNPPYFTTDAMALLDERGVAHLLTDLPSLDREDDGGALASHRTLWGVPAGHKGAVTLDERARRTVTELCRLEHVPEGRYLLSLQVAPLASDAAPSRPLLHPLEPV